MPFDPTPEQHAIVEAYATTDDNLLIDALAGAAKTSTLVLMAAARREATLAIAFNKRIATELQTRMPSHVECKTLNAVGHRALSGILSGRPRLQADKRRTILRREIDTLNQAEKDLAWGAWRDLTQALANATAWGWIPEKVKGKRLLTDAKFFEVLPFVPSELEERLIYHTAQTAIEEVFTSRWIDFDDQILIPTLYPCQFDHYPITMVDEAQDLSLLNHAMLRKMVGKRRLIAVGDQRQAIYGFRGADEGSMAALEETFAMRKLQLSTSFRCPRSAVEHVKWRAPHMQSPSWAAAGSIDYWPTWSAAQIEDGAAIICRNNAPLLRTAMRLLGEGRRPELIGNDVVKGLLRDLKRLGPPQTRQEDALASVDAWETEQERRYKGRASTADKAECMRIFVRAQPTLGAALAYAEQVVNASGVIKLMTGHKSKGLEFDVVYFLDEHLVKRGEDAGQDTNLRYVICTRTKDRLIYITSEGYNGANDDS